MRFSRYDPLRPGTTSSLPLSRNENSDTTANLIGQANREKTNNMATTAHVQAHPLAFRTRIAAFFFSVMPWSAICAEDSTQKERVAL
jgi:hypothetical protein